MWLCCRSQVVIQDLSVSGCNVSNAIDMSQCSNSSFNIISNMGVIRNEAANANGTVTVSGSCNLILDTCDFLHNRGIGVMLRNGAGILISNSTFFNNSNVDMGLKGGAILVENGSQFHARDCNFSNNTGQDGGALHVEVRSF